MNKKELIKRQEELVTFFTNDTPEYLDMLEEFYEISIKLNKENSNVKE